MRFLGTVPLADRALRKGSTVIRRVNALILFRHSLRHSITIMPLQKCSCPELPHHERDRFSSAIFFPRPKSSASMAITYVFCCSYYYCDCSSPVRFNPITYVRTAKYGQRDKAGIKTFVAFRPCVTLLEMGEQVIEPYILIWTAEPKDEILCSKLG